MSNLSSRLLGTHTLKSLLPRCSSTRLERLPSSGGISPLKALSRRLSSVTRPSPSVLTPSHSPRGASLSQLSFLCQFSPFVVFRG